jgi:hypothetical protein
VVGQSPGDGAEVAFTSTCPKRVEHRDIKPCWTGLLSKVDPPFLLRLRNGMQRRAPELPVVVTKVRNNFRSGNYDLHLRRTCAILIGNVILHRGDMRRESFAPCITIIVRKERPSWITQLGR